jgi:alpha-tubulin suppressor-like RCC1 family protein
MHHIFTKVSDMGQVWGWGYGGEGQLGLGTRVKTVATPHTIPCIEPPASGKGSMSSSTQVSKVLGSYVKGIACGGRHSAVITGQHSMVSFVGHITGHLF